MPTVKVRATKAPPASAAAAASSTISKPSVDATQLPKPIVPNTQPGIAAVVATEEEVSIIKETFPDIVSAKKKNPRAQHAFMFIANAAPFAISVKLNTNKQNRRKPNQPAAATINSNSGSIGRSNRARNVADVANNPAVFETCALVGAPDPSLQTMKGRPPQRKQTSCGQCLEEGRKEESSNCSGHKGRSFANI